MKGYDSHLIFHELKNFDVKINITPNELEKYMAFFLKKTNLVFIHNMKFVNSSLEKLVKYLSDDDFKHLTKEFGPKNLELLKQKGAYPYECMDSFKRFNKEKLPDKKCFFSSSKEGKIGDNDKKLDGHITHEEYLACEMKNLA